MSSEPLPPQLARRSRVPGEPIRVLVVDDSPTARALLTALCDADPALEVIAAVADGATALERTANLRPDIVVMDIFMPGMDGYTATRRIMVETPTPVVLVTAAADPRSREIGLRSLEAGALTVLAKPSGDGPEAVAFVATIHALADVHVIRRYDRRRDTPPPAAGPTISDRQAPVELVAVAASTGGPAALQRMISALPNDLAIPMVVVQHITEGFTAGLVAWLDQHSALSVEVARGDARLQPGVIHVGPDGKHLEVASSGRIQLSDDPPLGGFRPSATRMFQSVARVYGANSAAVVLTGMGGDGLDGVRALRAAGGVVLAQDEATSVVFGMPGVVVREGLAHEIGPVERLAATIGRLTTSRHP